MKIIKISFFLFLLSLTAKAQDNTPLWSMSPFDLNVTNSISVHYGVSIPLGDQRNYIDRVSPTNAVVQAEWQFPKHITAGLKTGYQYNDQRFGRQVYQFDDGAVSAVQTRTMTVIPAMATVAYYVTDHGAALRPYIQLAGGGAFVDYTNYYGTLADQNSGFRGAVAPAVGLKFYGKRDSGLGGEVQAQYQHVFYKYAELTNSPSLLLSAGLTWRW